MGLLAHLEELSDARSIETLWQMHCRRMADYGFDRLIYGYTRFRTRTSLGDPEDFVVLTNHGPEYSRVFMDEALFFHAPMVRWALDNEGASSWRLIARMRDQGSLTPQEAEVVEFNRSHGVVAGYTISFKSFSSRFKGAIALTARRDMSQDDADAVWAEHGQAITVMNNIVHLKIQTLPFAAPARHLTDRQREVLGWVGDGKKVQDIATLMGLTPATVDKHLRLARESLNVETTAQAVLKAAFLNQVFVIDPLEEPAG